MSQNPYDTPDHTGQQGYDTPQGDGYQQHYGAPQSPPPGHGAPYGQPGQPSQSTAYGSTQPYGQYPQYPAYGQQPGQPYQSSPPQRSTAMTVVGSIFAVIAALFALSFLVNLTRTSSMGGGAGFIIGYLIGGLIIVGIPALIAYLCFTAHTRKAKKLSQF